MINELHFDSGCGSKSRLEIKNPAWDDIKSNRLKWKKGCFEQADGQPRRMCGRTQSWIGQRMDQRTKDWNDFFRIICINSVNGLNV